VRKEDGDTRACKVFYYKRSKRESVRVRSGGYKDKCSYIDDFKNGGYPRLLFSLSFPLQLEAHSHELIHQ